MDPYYDNDVNKIKTYSVGPPVPCINCITLPICRSYLLSKKLPRESFLRANGSPVKRDAVLELYRRCSTVADYICRYNSGEDKSITPNVKAVYLFENSYLLQKTIIYILEGKEI
jgi:hypothetical protein